MTAVAYRVYELPWTPCEADQRRLRRVLGAALGIFIGLGIVIPFLPETPRTIATAPPVPERIVEFLLERPKPPPEPPPAVEVPRPVPQVEKTPQVERQRPVRAPVTEAAPRPDARERAASSGLLAMSDQLAEIRNLDVDHDRPVESLDNAAGDRVQVDRALLTARTGEGSGGIAVAQASRGFGGSAGTLSGHRTAKVEAASAPAAEAKRTGRSSQASRTREEVELVFDRNKSAIYAIYARALRDNPALAGKVVLEVTIAPTGEVTQCRVVSSDLGDAELERKLVSRVKMFRFEARDVAPMTTTKPIEFFPA